MKNLFYTMLSVISLASCSKEEQTTAPPPTPTFTLNFSADTGGTVSTEGGTYNQGSKITVTATPDGQFLFKEWSDGSTQNPLEITVTSNLTLKASFIKKTYQLSVTIDGEGTVQEQVIIQGSTTETEYNAGTTVRLTATANEGWVFAGWSGDIESDALVIEVPIEKGTSVSALFKRDSFELNITIEGEGTVKEEVIVQPGQYDYETVVRLTAVPADGWKFASWSGDVESEEVVIEVELTSEINLTVNFEYAFFVSKAENYSPINQTTGYYSKTSSFFRYISLEEGRYFSEYFNHQYLVDNFDAITYDFNGDGYLDLFMFAMHAGPWGDNGGYHQNGKYFIIPNYFNQSPPYNIIEHNSIMEFAAGGIDLQDLNGDGRKEVLIFNDNGHQINTPFVLNGSNPPVQLGIVVLDIDESFNLISQTVVGTPKNVHRGTSGDVDNDGDIDILNFPLGDPSHKTRFEQFPTILYNTGNGVFNEELIFKDQSFEDYYYMLRANSVNFFDVDNDGYLDLIFGYKFGTPPEPMTQYPGVNWFEYENGYKYTFILWGDGSGKFDFENKSALQINNELGFSVSLLGMGFSDFDEDGDIDIILQATRSEIDGTFENGGLYFSYVLYLFENNGNRKFTDVTSSKIDGYYHIENDHLGDMGEMMAIDKNGDGLIDLVPKDVKLFCCLGNPSINYVSNLWWENIGGSFVRRIENY